MAYVAISGSLVERVKTKINTMKQAEMNTLGKFDPVYSPNASFVVDSCWGEHKNLLPLMPKEWLQHSKTFYGKFKINEEPLRHTFNFSGEVDFPPHGSYYQDKEINIDAPELSELKAHYEKVAEIVARWRKVETDVLTFLAACKSLNEALKSWPGLSVYLDKEDIERVGVKREKARESEALKALAAMDTDALVGAAVIARMSGATV